MRIKTLLPQSAILAAITLFLTCFIITTSTALKPGRGELERKIVRLHGDEEDCELLPEGEEEEDEPPLELLDLLTKGSEYLRNYTDANEAILLLGNTGSGKSTLAQMIAGDLGKLHALLAPGDRLVIVDEDNKIGAPSTKSKTLIPDLIMKPGNASAGIPPLAFYDCPGFDDTRGAVPDIAANFFVNEITGKFANAKMLFLVIHSSLKPGNDRMDFDLLAKHAATFVKNMTKYQDSIALVVTKVDSFNNRGKYIEDATIMTEITSFLTIYNKTIHGDLGSGDPEEEKLTKNKIAFVESLLHQDDMTGNYSRIWFVRSPIDCGRLNESEMYQEMKRTVVDMYENLEYTGVDSKTDFGFTLKDRTRLSIANFTKTINKAITDGTVKVMNDLTNTFSRKLKQINSNTLNLTSFLETLRGYRDGVKKMSQEIDQLTSNPEKASTAQISGSLARLWATFEQPLSSRFQDFLSWQDTFLNFFDEATGTRQRRDVLEWVVPMKNFVTPFENVFEWYDFCFKVSTRVHSYDFQKLKPKLPSSDTINWLDFIDANNDIPISVSETLREFAKDPARNIELDVLDNIMRFALEAPIIKVTCPGAITKVIYQDNFVLVANVTSKISSLTGSCNKEFIQLELRATHTLFQDADINRNELDLVLLAPNWVNTRTDQVNIVLGGTPGAPQYPAQNGTDEGRGQNGCAGKPGKAGGTFFSLTSFIESPSKLHIHSQGGTGGNGQDGGKGGVGVPGKDAKHSDNYDKIKREWYCYVSLGINCDEYKWHYGFNGGNGGNGGNGAISGVGASPGEITLLQLRESSPISVVETKQSGENGAVGKAGAGGEGGAAGWGYYCHENWGWFGRTIVEFTKRVPSNGRGPGKPGLAGETGTSNSCLETPSKARVIEKWPEIHGYRMATFLNSNPITRMFLTDMDKSTEISKMMPLKTLAEESLATQQLNQSSLTSDQLEGAYTSLIGRLEIYRSTHWNSLTPEHKKIVSILLATQYILLKNLKVPVQRVGGTLDISAHFDQIRQQMQLIQSSPTVLLAVRKDQETMAKQLEVREDQIQEYVQDSVQKAIDAAGTSTVDKLGQIENILQNLVNNTKLSIKECKERLRKNTAQQGTLRFIKLFDVIRVLNPNGTWPKFDYVVAYLRDRFEGQPEKLERLNSLVRESTELVSDLEQKKNDLKVLVESIISRPECIVGGVTQSSFVQMSYIQAESSCSELLNDLQKFRRALVDFEDCSLSERKLGSAFMKMQEASSFVLAIYRLRQQNEMLRSVASHIETVYSSDLDPIEITDPELKHYVENYQTFWKANLLSIELRKARNVFNEFVFPFAKFYPSSGDASVDHLVELEELWSYLERYRKLLTVGKDRTLMMKSNFSSDVKSSNAFFTWKNEDYAEDILSLLSGKSVEFYADLRLQGRSGWEAIKCNQIEINLQLVGATTELQKEFDELLNHFGVSMTHVGASNYRFQKDFYITTLENFKSQYNFQRDANGNRLGTNLVYENFKAGDFMVSPYTTWIFQLRQVTPMSVNSTSSFYVTFEVLEKFLPYVEIELVGMGVYVKGQEAKKAAGGDMELDKFYERNEGFHDQIF